MSVNISGSNPVSSRVEGDDGDDRYEGEERGEEDQYPSCSGEDIVGMEPSSKRESMGVNTRGASEDVVVLSATGLCVSRRSRAKLSIVLRKLCSVEDMIVLRRRSFCGLSSQEMFL